MSYEPQSFAGFGAGLNLKAKADAVSEEEAIDCLNVRFTETGAVAQRFGYDELTSSTLTNRAASLHEFYTSSGTRQLIAGCGTRLEALNTSGGVVASLTGLTDGTWDFARFAAPGSEYIYAGQGNQTLRRWDGTTWSAVASTPQGGALAVMSVDQGNRMVVGRFNTTTGGPTGGAGTSNPSRVHFSDAGAPETWGTNNYVDFTPGDGEKVQAVLAWRELLFIFKESKFFVVNGSSEDASGDPVFEWYAIDTGIGLATPRAIAANETGVYFLDRTGVYRTTGGDPEYLSEAVEPIIRGGSSDFFTGGELLHSQIGNCAMGIHEGVLYLGYTSAGTANDYTLVYDTEQGWWALDNLPAAAFASFRIGSQAELVFAGSTGDNDVYRHNSTLTSDNGTAISSHWRSGWFDYGLPITKTIRETKVWGSGEPFLAVSTDFQSDVGDLDQLDLSDPDVATWNVNFWNVSTWEIPAALIDDLRRRAVRGTVFSTYLSNSTLDTTFSIHRLDHHLRESRVPSIARG